MANFMETYPEIEDFSSELMLANQELESFPKDEIILDFDYPKPIVQEATPKKNGDSLLDEILAKTEGRKAPRRAKTIKKNQKSEAQKKVLVPVSEVDSTSTSSRDEAGSSDMEPSGDKKARKRLQNRLSAHRCRQRKKNYLDSLEGKNTELTDENSKLCVENATLKSENNLLKKQLEFFEKMLNINKQQLDMQPVSTPVQMMQPQQTQQQTINIQPADDAFSSYSKLEPESDFVNSVFGDDAEEQESPKKATFSTGYNFKNPMFMMTILMGVICFVSTLLDENNEAAFADIGGKRLLSKPVAETTSYLNMTIFSGFLTVSFGIMSLWHSVRAH